MMNEFLPLIIACAVIGLFTLAFVAAYFVLKRRVKHPENERHMSDAYLIRRLLNEETLVFHPLENTASVAMRGEDFFGTFLRAVCKPYTLVDMEQKGDFHA